MSQEEHQAEPGAGQEALNNAWPVMHPRSPRLQLRTWARLSLHSTPPGPINGRPATAITIRNRRSSSGCRTLSTASSRPGMDGFPCRRPSPASAGFLRSSFRVSYYGATPQTYMTRSVTVGSILGQKDPTGEIRNPVDLGVVTVPLYGNVISYPFDSYSASGDWQVFPPPGTAISNSEGIRLSWTPSVAVTATPDSKNLAWRVSSPQSADYVIEASRIPFAKFFVCLIARLPLFLFAGLLALVWSLADDPERRRFPAELLVGVGAFLLAIIPVRTVLVPADISQITLTDYLLGAEMAVMLAGSLIIVLAGTASPGKRGPVAGEDTTHSNSETPPGTQRLLSRHDQAPAAGNPGSDPREMTKRRNVLIGKVLPGIAGAAALVSIWQLLNRARRS